MTTEQLPEGLNIAIEMIGEYVESVVTCNCNPATGELAPHAEIDQRHGVTAIDAIRAEHAKCLTLQHRAAEQAQRIADLEAKCCTLKELHDAAADERDALRSANAHLHSQVAYWHRKAVETRNEGREIESHLSGRLDVVGNELRSVMAERDALRARLAASEASDAESIRMYRAARAKYDELLVALHGIGSALGLPEGDRSPYSITCGTLERFNKLAEIEAQEPVMWRIKQGARVYVISNDEFVRSSFDAASMTPLYAKPIPATAGPAAWIEHELSGTGQRHLHFERRPSCLRDEVIAPVWTPLFSGPVPAQAVPDGWRPMNSAPRDGTAVLALLVGSDVAHAVRWLPDGNKSSGSAGWHVVWDLSAVAQHDGPTHWMPIPDAPEHKA